MSFVSVPLTVKPNFPLNQTDVHIVEIYFTKYIFKKKYISVKQVLGAEHSFKDNDNSQSQRQDNDKLRSHKRKFRNYLHTLRLF